MIRTSSRKEMSSSPVDYVNNYLALTRDIYWLDAAVALGMQRPRNAITCVDGFVLSVQASEHTYCSPRDNDGPWTQVECMLIKGKLTFAAWDEYEDGTGEVYGYVPVELVNREIHSHGGTGEGDGRQEQVQDIPLV